MDTVSEEKLMHVHPLLAAKIRQLNSDYSAVVIGDSLRVVQGFRSYADQQVLWEKGRDTEGNIIDASRVVTHAPPGHSWHEFGLAVDVCPVSLIGTPGWSVNSPLWAKLGSLGVANGLTWGGNWSAGKVDKPHFQLTGNLPVSPSSQVRAEFAKNGVGGVWDMTGYHLA